MAEASEPVINFYQRRCERLADSLEGRLLRAEIVFAVDRYCEYFERHGLQVYISWGRDTKPSSDDGNNIVLFFDWNKARNCEAGGSDGGEVA